MHMCPVDYRQIATIVVASPPPPTESFSSSFVDPLYSTPSAPLLESQFIRFNTSPPCLCVHALPSIDTRNGHRTGGRVTVIVGSSNQHTLANITVDKKKPEPQTEKKYNLSGGERGQSTTRGGQNRPCSYRTRGE